jgi:hypothetical protein
MLGALALLSGAAPPAAAADPLIVGACALMTLRVDYTPALSTTVPAAASTRVDVLGSTSCLVSGGPWVAVTLDGFGTTAVLFNTFSCAGGVAAGEGSLTAPTHDGFPADGAEGELIVAMAGGVGSLTLVSRTGRVVAQGEFLQDTADTVACPSSGLSTTSWTGALAFAITGVAV